MKPFEKDTIMKVTSYRIESYTTLLKPFSGHYRHKQTQIKPIQDTIVVQKETIGFLLSNQAFRIY